MAAFFLLMSAYVVPDKGNRETFFAELELIDKKGNGQGEGSLAWYKKLAFGVLQWVPVSIITWIATIIALAASTYCATSNKPHFAHIWVRFSSCSKLCTLLQTVANTPPLDYDYSHGFHSFRHHLHTSFLQTIKRCS